MPIDELDARIIRLFAQEPRVGVLEASRRLKVARGTVQARLDRMTRAGIVTGFGPDVDPAAIGYGVTAFATLEIRQGHGHEASPRTWRRSPRCSRPTRSPARPTCTAGSWPAPTPTCSGSSTGCVAFGGIERTSTVVALATQVPFRVLPLVDEAAR